MTLLFVSKPSSLQAFQLIFMLIKKLMHVLVWFKWMTYLCIHVIDDNGQLLVNSYLPSMLELVTYFLFPTLIENPNMF